MKAALLAVPLLLGAGAHHPTPKKGRTAVSKSFEVEGKRVTEAQWVAKRRTLEGNFEYHCKKTTFGGVVSYKAHDAEGHWYRVVKVSGGTQPSRIESTKAPEHSEDEDDMEESTSGATP